MASKDIILNIVKKVIETGKSNDTMDYSCLIACDFNIENEFNCSNLGFCIDNKKILFSSLQCSPNFREKVSPGLFEFAIAHELSHSVCLNITEYPTQLPDINDNVEELTQYVGNSKLEAIFPSHSKYTEIVNRIESVAKENKLLVGLSQDTLEFLSDNYAGKILDLGKEKTMEFLLELKELCQNSCCKDQIDRRIAALEFW